MTYNEHLLTILGEEAVEVAQRVSKALRFGLEEVQPGQAENNADRIMREYAELVAVLEMCQDNGLLPVIWRQHVEDKKAKVTAFLAYSGECGTITPETRTHP